jgi:hypothetical protein
VSTHAVVSRGLVSGANDGRRDTLEAIDAVTCGAGADAGYNWTPRGSFINLLEGW